MVETVIASKETVCGDQGMRSDQKIGGDPIAPASAYSISAPGVRRFNRRLFRHR